uniref:Protein translocase subunit SecY n=1 Tax=Plagiogramma staurophorum TaxID=1003089 RepID=A0A2U9NN75_9STRA|nr:preprotein translocase subunit SecY [Plagiogramma staurophorum]AWT38336.1 preprotein translocase subunit SecY [Plagiogramma staurophorum]
MKNIIVIINKISDKRFVDILFQRVLLTLVVLLFIRVGTFLPVPEINLNDLAVYIQRHSFTKSLVSTFSGDDTFVIGLFTLNIIPYINASILIQLIISISPKLKKLQQEGDATGRRVLNRLTRLITLILAVIQSSSIAFYLKRILFDWNLLLAFDIVLWLTAGAMIVLWFSELITEYGLGNGASLLIYINIVSNFPNLFRKIFAENSNNLTIASILIINLLLLVSLYGIVILQRGVRKIPLISSKELSQVSLPSSAQTPNYIPLGLNQAGVMPIILTTAVLVIPGYISNLGLIPNINITLPLFAKLSNFIYWIIYFGLILKFSSFYSTLILNPKDISDQLQKMTVSVAGIRPGLETTFYLLKVMKRVTFLGSVLLAFLATVPNIIEATFNISSLNGLSTTSLLIVAGVILDVFREVRSIYYSTIYNDMYR